MYKVFPVYVEAVHDCDISRHWCLCCSDVLSGSVADAVLCSCPHLAHCGVIGWWQLRFCSLLLLFVLTVSCTLVI